MSNRHFFPPKNKKNLFLYNPKPLPHTSVKAYSALAATKPMAGQRGPVKSGQTVGGVALSTSTKGVKIKAGHAIPKALLVPEYGYNDCAGLFTGY